jgi:hypothetical protein
MFNLNGVFYEVGDSTGDGNSVGSGVLQTGESVTIVPYFSGVKGTFHFTAVNMAAPTDVITIANGEFVAQKEEYNPGG